MNILRRLILGKQTADAVDQLKAMYQPGQRYIVSNGQITSPSDRKDTYIKDGYSSNDIIYAVANMVMDKVRLPEWQIYKVVNEGSLKKYRSIMTNKFITGKDYSDALQHKYDALEPVTNFNLRLGKLKSLLDYPNDEETFQEQVANGIGFKILTGDEFLYGNILKSGANAGIPNSLELLPAQYVVINAVTGVFPAKAAWYELLTWNQRFDKTEVMHDKYWNPNWSINGEQLYGMSALKASMRNLNRNNSAKDASTAKFQNGGLEEIIFMDDARFSGDDAEAQVKALKRRLAAEYSGPANQGKRAVSGYKVGTVQLGSTPVDLDIINAEKWDAVMFCNVWGVPPELLGLVQKTYNNVKEAEKALTTRSAIPLLNSKRNSLNRKLKLDWGFKDDNIYVDYDTSCFGELKNDMASVVSATSKMIMITPNEERDLAGLKALPDPEADEVWVQSGNGRVPLSDYQASIVDNVLNNDQQGNNQNGNGEVPADGSGAQGVQN